MLGIRTLNISVKLANLLLNITKLLNQQSAGIIVFVALFFWENKREEEQLAQISRNETLSRLPLRLSTNRVVELVQLRDTVRPVSNPCIFYLIHLKPFPHLCLELLQSGFYLGNFSREEGNCLFSYAES